MSTPHIAVGTFTSTTIDRVRCLVARAVGCDAVEILLWGDAASGSSDSPPPFASPVDSATWLGAIRPVAGDRETMVTDASVEAGGERELSGPGALATVPINRPHGTTIGFLAARSTQPREWSEPEMAFLRDSAALIASAWAIETEIDVPGAGVLGPLLAAAKRELDLQVRAATADFDAATDPLNPARQRLERAIACRRRAEQTLRQADEAADLSRSGHHPIVVNSGRAAVAREIADVHHLLTPSARNRGSTLEAALRGPVPSLITTDPGRLQQILTDVVAYTIQTASPGRILVEVAHDREAAILSFTISDAGGRPSGAELASWLRLATIDDAVVVRDPPPELGMVAAAVSLLLCRRLARAMGGDLAARDHAPHRRVLTITLATGPVEGVQMLSDWREADLRGPDPTAGTRPVVTLSGTVLLVEDGIDTQRLIAALLRRSGLIVEIAQTGREALARFTVDGTPDGPLRPDPPFQLVLMDMQLPDVDGYEATRILRARGHRGPVVALTATSSEPELKACLAAGCNEYAMKPIERGALIELCRKYLRPGG